MVTIILIIKELLRSVGTTLRFLPIQESIIHVKLNKNLPELTLRRDNYNTK